MCLGVWSILGYVKYSDVKAVVVLPELRDKTLTQTRKNPYPGYGCGFWWVRVWVALEYPRVTRDNP
jgi:hypothetical protein